MKFIHLLLIFNFVTFGSVFQTKGMSYWERAKSYFTSSNQQKILNELNDLLKVSRYESAFYLFEKIYPQSNSKQQEELKQIIANNAIDRVQLTSDQPDKDDFIDLFLKPAFEIAPNLYNYIFNRITQKYFNEIFPPDFQLIFSKNIEAFSRDYLSSKPGQVISIQDINNKIKDDATIWRTLDFLIRLTAKDNNQVQEQWLKILFDNFDQFFFQKNLFFAEYFIKTIGYFTFINYLATNIESILLKHSKSVILMFASLGLYEKNIHIYSAEKIQRRTEQAKKISAAITKNIMLFNNVPQVDYLFFEDQSLLIKDISLPEMVSIALSHIKELSTELAESLLRESFNSQLAQAIISQKDRFPEPLITLAQDILVDATDSPTAFHLKRYDKMVKQTDIFKLFHQNQELKKIYSLYRNKEKALNQKGYYTFVHGQERRYYFPEKLFTHLWGLRKNKSVENFLFAHVKDLIETPEAQFEEDITRKTIHMAGAIKESESYDVDISRRKKILFMNYAFFANAGNVGSNSPSYVTANANSPMGSAVNISAEEPFTLLGYKWIYKKHEQEIEQLAQDYNNLSKYGNMLLIAVPKDKIYKYVYLCKSGGLQKPLEKKDGTQITDIRIAMETLLKTPETLKDSDRVEFCLIMTQQKGGLDPSTGIQIYPLLSGDPEKLKALQAREKVLLDKITADVKEAEKQQALQRAAKIAGHVVESAEAKP
jgi:hypothetical protein